MMRVKHLLVIFLLSPSFISGSSEHLSPNSGSEYDQTTHNKKNDDSVIDPKTNDDQTLTVVRRETAKYPDTNDYWKHPVCGDKPLGSNDAACYCGSDTLSGVGDLLYGDSFCCVAPEDECDQDGLLHVRCPTGTKQLKSQPCHGQCYNSYTTSENLWYTGSLYCEEDNFCIPLPQICSGICKIEEELCSSDVRCPYHGYEEIVERYGLTDFTVQSLGGKKTSDHKYCFAVNNDGLYDSISRLDEDKVATKHNKLFEYSDLMTTCHHDDGDEGIMCEEGCMPNTVWCAGTGRVCTTAGGPVGRDNVDLCRNNSFWQLSRI